MRHFSPLTMPFLRSGALLCAIALTLMVGMTAQAQSGSRGGMGGGPGMGGPQPEPEKKRPRFQVFEPIEKIPVVLVDVIGTNVTPRERVLSMLMTRQGRLYDPTTVQRDVRTLVESGLFQDVRTFKRQVEGGMAITFQIVERPVIQYVRYVGNEKVKDKALNKELNLSRGDPLNRFAVEEARRSLQQIYSQKGYGEAHVEIIEGTKPQDKGVVFRIHEGQITRIYKVEFVGNTIATDARLKTQISSKPGILWLFGGKANQDTIDQDRDRLTGYYRSLGFFRARVGRQIEYNNDRSWMTIKFIIDEGVRYRINDIQIVGNKTIASNLLRRQSESRRGDYFNLTQMQRDLGKIRDEYGSRGFIFADVQAEPRFKETPGELDIVFKVNEGKQFRVGKIIVKIDGENAQTKRSVVLNRLSIRPGDIVDVRELRNSERRLQSSQLFLHNPAAGVTPKIVVKPPPVDNETQIAEKSDTIRGQSPRVSYRPIEASLQTVDIIVDCYTNPNWSNPPNHKATSSIRFLQTPEGLNR